MKQKSQEVILGILARLRRGACQGKMKIPVEPGDIYE
jgi:hypothetical protein